MTEYASRERDHAVVGPDRPVHKVSSHEGLKARYPPCEKDDAVEPDDAEAYQLGRRGMQVGFGETDVDSSYWHFKGFRPVSYAFDEAIEAIL